MHKFLIIIEVAGENFSAYSPDLPGCVAVGDTREETEQNMYEAIQLHIEGMIEDGDTVPVSKSNAHYVAIPKLGKASND
jgi:predicted RNase H-like HicB family nuclease